MMSHIWPISQIQFEFCAALFTICNNSKSAKKHEKISAFFQPCHLYNFKHKMSFMWHSVNNILKMSTDFVNSYTLVQLHQTKRQKCPTIITWENLFLAEVEEKHQHRALANVKVCHRHHSCAWSKNGTHIIILHQMSNKLLTMTKINRLPVHRSYKKHFWATSPEYSASLF